MRKPVLTAQQIAACCAEPLIIGEPKRVTCNYTVDNIPCMGRFKVTQSAENVYVTCPDCGCSVRQLYAAIGSTGERRPGLWCIDCQVKTDRGEPSRIGYSRKATKKRKAA